MFLTFYKIKIKVSPLNYFSIVLLRLIKITIFSVQEAFPFGPFVVDEQKLCSSSQSKPPYPLS